MQDASSTVAGPQLRYPFEPRSTRLLRPGQFWAVPLPDGRFTCGRVLQLWGSHLPSLSRGFFGGLADWVDDRPPTAEAIAGTAVVAHGVMHVRSIVSTGGVILGHRPLDDAAALPHFASDHGGTATMLLRGADGVRPLDAAEARNYPVLTYWGATTIRELAERRFARDAGPG